MAARATGAKGLALPAETVRRCGQVTSGEGTLRDSLDIRLEADGRSAAIVLEGDLDLAGAPALVDAVATLCRDGASSVVLDLSRLQFIDSAGLRSLLTAQTLCAEHGCALSLTPAGRRVQRVFELAGVLDVLPFQDPSAGEAQPRVAAERRERP